MISSFLSTNLSMINNLLNGINLINGINGIIYSWNTRSNYYTMFTTLNMRLKLNTTEETSKYPSNNFKIELVLFRSI